MSLYCNKLLMLPALMLLLGSGSQVMTQTPSREMLTGVKRAVVIVTTYDGRNRPLRQGSGFFLAPDRIVTNLHVIGGASQIRIKTIDGKTVSVQSVVAVDAHSDLALLQTSMACPNATTLKVEYASPLVGESIFVVANPLGSHWKVTSGRVGTMWEFNDAGTRMQITASVLPGSSGGPVLNQRGYVIGIAVMHTESGDDLNFAVPAESLKALEAAANVADFRPLAQSQQPYKSLLGPAVTAGH